MKTRGEKVGFIWRDETPRRGADNMALDLALLHRAALEGVLVLRLYRWAPFCLSFGCHEPASRRYDRAEIERRGIDTVRRPTGGRAVWHARELTYAVAAPGHALGTLPQAYRRIHDGLARALASLGARATLAPKPPRATALGAGACFAAAAGGEVLVDGHKVVGSAQVRTSGGILQHGSILLEDDQQLVADLAGQPTPSGGTPLSAVLGRPVSWEETAEAVVRHAAPSWSLSWRTMEGTDALVGAAAGTGSFRDPAWTWRR